MENNTITFKDDGSIPEENKKFVEKIHDPNNHYMFINTEMGYVAIHLTTNKVYNKDITEVIGTAKFTKKQLFITWKGEGNEETGN